jgi:hypothetical protein
LIIKQQKPKEGDMMRYNKTNKNQTDQQAKEQAMKWTMMTLTVLALIFVFSGEGVQAQPGGGGGGCTDSTGAPIPCPDDEPTTDDNGEPCDDEDGDRVCDSDEPERCIGQVNEDGSGCELPDNASPSESLIGLIATFEPVIPRDNSHDKWIDIMALAQTSLEMINFNFSPCGEGEPADWIELASRGDTAAMGRLGDIIRVCTRDGDWDGNGTVGTSDWFSFKNLGDTSMYTVCDGAGFCDIATFKRDEENSANLFLICDPAGACAVSPSNDQRPGANTTCDSAGNCLDASPTSIEPAPDSIDDLVVLPGAGVGARSNGHWGWSDLTLVESAGASTASDESVVEFENILRGLRNAVPEFDEELRLMAAALGQWDRRVNDCQTPRGEVTGTVKWEGQAPPASSASAQQIYDDIVNGCGDPNAAPIDPPNTADGESSPPPATTDGQVDIADFNVWNFNPSSADSEPFCMFELRLPGTDQVFVVFIEKTEDELASKKISVGNLPFLTKPGNELDGDVED